MSQTEQENALKFAGSMQIRMTSDLCHLQDQEALSDVMSFDKNVEPSSNKKGQICYFFSCVFAKKKKSLKLPIELRTNNKTSVLHVF